MRRILILISFIFISVIAITASANSLSLSKVLTPRTENSSSNEKNELQVIQKNIDYWKTEKYNLDEKSKNYQNIIDNFPAKTQALQQELIKLNQNSVTVPDNLTTTQIEQRLSQASSNSVDLARQIQQLKEGARDIIESVNQYASKQATTRKLLQQAEQRLANLAIGSPFYASTNEEIQSEIAAYQALLNNLEIEQPSANNRQELNRLELELLQKQYDKNEQLLSLLRQEFNNRRQEEAKKTLDSALFLAEQHTDLPEELSNIIQTNAKLSMDLNQQAQRLNDLSDQQQLTNNNIIKVKQAINLLEEQSRWLSMSTGLGEILRLQLSQLPAKPKPHHLDQEIANVRLSRLNYENQLRELNEAQLTFERNAAKIYSKQEIKLFKDQESNQRNLLNGLISNSNSLMLSLSNLKISDTQLSDALNAVNIASHKYFFWVADVDPITLHYPVDVVSHLVTLFNKDTLHQLVASVDLIGTTPLTSALILLSGLAILLRIALNKRFIQRLESNANLVGKVNHDTFMVTFSTLFWSILSALPIPLLWGALGFGLQNAWNYPIAQALSQGFYSASPILWMFMICARFALPNGLFIAHFNWPAERVRRAIRYYQFLVWLIIPSILSVVTLSDLDNRYYASTLGRLSFILLAITLIFASVALKRVNVPLHIDRKGSTDNIINRTLWAILLIAPWLAAIAAAIGYLRTSEILLGRLEASVVVLFSLLLIYYTIRRWMLIQRRKLAFERAKQRRAERLSQRANTEPPALSTSSSDNTLDIEEPVVDLDVISSQSLKLVRSILTMIGLIALILLWSELHSAFTFLENISLWSSNSTVNGTQITHQVTLGSVLIAILVLVITVQLIHNLPALLELTILQHLDLNPGTGYAISTITKYSITFIGVIVACSIIGIEWKTVQWLIAALGVGLGFGLQEIFANFISGLILLFEKPIRIGDTITINNFTGTVSKIKTRATTMVDWDRKEIIVPNKSFITEQLINWSLSDSVTRIVLTIPAEMKTDSELIIAILKEAAKKCNYVLDNPQPEVFLVDVQEGIQLFELRVFAAEMSQRMPLRNELNQLIIQGYEENNLKLPFPPFQMDVMGRGRVSNHRYFKSGDI